MEAKNSIHNHTFTSSAPVSALAGNRSLFKSSRISSPLVCLTLVGIGSRLGVSFAQKRRIERMSGKAMSPLIDGIKQSNPSETGVSRWAVLGGLSFGASSKAGWKALSAEWNSCLADGLTEHSRTHQEVATSLGAAASSSGHYPWLTYS